jgi:uncharacterized protein
LRRCSALTGLVLACASFACSQTAPAASSAAQPNAAKLAKIRELIELSDAAGMAAASMKAQAGSIKKLLPLPPRAQDDFERELLAAVDINELMSLLIPIYDQHLSEEDLDSMLTFYRSPAGKRFIKALPLIAAESRQVGEEWGQGLGRKVGEKIGEKLAHGDYGPWPPEHQDSPPEKH